MTAVTFNPTCSLCGKRMGEMSGDEFEALVIAEGLGAKCFDCQRHPETIFCYPVAVGMVGDTKIEDGIEFWLARSVDGLLRWRSQSKQGNLRVASYSLSSSTYLNTFPKRNGNWEVGNVNNAKCPNCGIWEAEQWDDGLRCRSCGFQERQIEAVIPPGWVEANGQILPKRKSVDYCQDCEEKCELDGPGRYCAYHHALLVEQFEDGSLGYGNA